jgi:hypothetical protein
LEEECKCYAKLGELLEARRREKEKLKDLKGNA